jgi:hypothetical protein
MLLLHLHVILIIFYKMQILMVHILLIKLCYFYTFNLVEIIYKCSNIIYMYIQDCSNGMDEKNCSNSLDSFIKTPEAQLIYHEVEKWLHTTVHTCANRCMQANGFMCLSFSHKSVNIIHYILTIIYKY